METKFEIIKADGKKSRPHKNTCLDSEIERNVGFCKKVHSSLKSCIDASISTKIFDDTLITTITKATHNIKFEIKVNEINNYISEGSKGVDEVTQLIGQEYAEKIQHIFFY